MAFQQGPLWSEENGIRCLAVMKRPQAEGFPSVRQAQCSRELAAATGLPARSVNAKVGNFKSLAGLIGPSNWLQNSEAIWKRYGHQSASEVQALALQCEARSLLPGYPKASGTTLPTR